MGRLVGRVLNEKLSKKSKFCCEEKQERTRRLK